MLIQRTNSVSTCSIYMTTTGKLLHVGGLTRSIVVTKETGPIVPEDGHTTTRTQSVSRIRNARQGTFPVARTDTKLVIRFPFVPNDGRRITNSTLLPRLHRPGLTRGIGGARAHVRTRARQQQKRCGFQVTGQQIIMDANRQRSKMFCGHCSQYVSKSTYYRHRRTFYDKKIRQWSKEQPMSSSLSSESGLSAIEDDPSQSLQLPSGCDDAGMIIASLGTSQPLHKRGKSWTGIITSL